VKTVEWTSLSENFVWAVRNVAPESSLLGRAAALVRLGFKQGSQRDLFETRCERGADSACVLGFPEQTAEAIRTLDEHWDGRQPLGLRGDEIPLLGRIVCVAQSIDVFAVAHGLVAAYRMAAERRGTWFDPELVEVLEAGEGDPFWARPPRAKPISWSASSSRWTASSTSTRPVSTASPARSRG